MPSARIIRRLATVVAIVVLACPASAAAHGDPSSHYLETEQLYPGFANRPSQQAELALLGLLEAARQDGYPIKVSIVGSRDDLTDDPSVVARPQAYAESVAAKLGRPNVKAPVVVLTQHGIGVAGVQLRDGGAARPITRAEAERLSAGIPVAHDADGDALAAAAERAIRELAAAGGHRLPAQVAPAKVLAPVDGGEGGGLDAGILLPIALFAGVFLTAWLYYETRTRLARRKHSAM